MPMKPPRICSCGRKVAFGVQCICQRERKIERDRKRPNANARGYDSKWQRASKEFLSRPENRFCACGCGRIADCVDHKQAHKGDMRLFWDRSNWRPMAIVCNTRKAISQEGGFGRS